MGRVKGGKWSATPPPQATGGVRQAGPSATVRTICLKSADLQQKTNHEWTRIDTNADEPTHGQAPPKCFCSLVPWYGFVSFPIYPSILAVSPPIDTSSISVLVLIGVHSWFVFFLLGQLLSVLRGCRCRIPPRLAGDKRRVFGTGKCLMTWLSFNLSIPHLFTLQTSNFTLQTSIKVDKNGFLVA